MKVFYNTDYHGSTYAMETTRKSELIADLVRSSSLPIDIVDPSNLYEETETLINQLHNPEYVKAVKTGKPRDLAESQGFNWDPKLFTLAVAHNAGCIGAVDTAMQDKTIAGTLSSGLHHARYDYGTGFCTFNGVALAAHRAIANGANRVLILDFDAHGGGGTQSLISDFADQDRVVQIDVVVSPFDLTIDDGTLSMTFLSDSHSYLTWIDHALRSAQRLHDAKKFDVVIYNAGMDPLNAGVTESQIEEREREVAAFLTSNNLPCAFTMAGGYKWGGFTLDEVAENHMVNISAMSAAASRMTAKMEADA